LAAGTALPASDPEQANPYKLLQLNRGQWAIENRSHYARDMAFDEDRSRIRVGNGPAIMACLRNLAIALARLYGFTNIASALRAFAYQPRRRRRLARLRLFASILSRCRVFLAGNALISFSRGSGNRL